MTTGAPIYLVSACASGEEFVAAFRRYADKNGLFVPIAAPIPAGRRGRFAVTLKDGGVMIEGEADIVSSATTPSVLHGRVGMTLRFVDPDIKSKTVLVELEQARVMLRPQPPSVPPRPAQVPAEPRPVVPAPSGRIDASNALAECVAIGDPSTLVETVPQVKAGPRFVVPTIPPVTQRPKSPSTPPVAYPAMEKKPTIPPLLAKTPTQPPPLVRPQTPSTPPPIKPLPAPAPMPTTSPGVGVVTAPTTTQPGVGAPVAAPVIVPVTPSGLTAVGPPPASITPMSITTVDAPLVEAQHTPTSLGIVPPPTSQGVAVTSITQNWDAPVVEGIDEGRDTLAMGTVASEKSSRNELVPFPQAREAETFTAVVPPGAHSDTYPAVQISQLKGETLPPPAPKPFVPVTHDSDTMLAAIPEPIPSSSSGSISRPNANGGSGKVGLPPPRRTTNQQQPLPKNPTPANAIPVLQMPRNPTPGAVPVVSKSSRPTRIGFPIQELKAPAQPSGEIVLPPIVAEPKPAAPEVADEPTDIGAPPIDAAIEPTPGPTPPIDAAIELTPGPTPPIDPAIEPTPAPAPVTAIESPRERRPSVPGGMRKTVIGVAVVPDGVTVLPATASAPLAKTEANERDTALVDAKRDSDQTPAAAARPPVVEEPSGDWTMVPGEAGLTILPRKIDPEKPVETPVAQVEDKPPEIAGAGKRLPTGDWTIVRVEDSPEGWSEPSKVDIQPLRQNIRANTGPPVAMVSGEKPLEVTSTAKQFDIEEETKSGIKVEIDDSLTALPRQSGSVDVSLASTQFASPSVPSMATPVPGTLQPAHPQLFAGASLADPLPRAPSASTGSGSFPNFQQQARQSGPAALFETSRGPTTAVIARRRRIVVIAVSAGVVVVAGIVLLIVMAGGDKPKPVAKQGSANVVAPVAPDAAETAAVNPVVVDAGGDIEMEEPPDASSAAVIPKDPPDDAPKDPPPGGKQCNVELASTPTGAEVVQGKSVLGVTPVTLGFPCGVEIKLVFRKARFASATRVFTPTEGSKVRTTLGKNQLSVKVTSSPPGATIMLNGKSLGVTPGMIKLPAFETSSLTITKPGFTADTQKITPKQNNQSVHATLKKKGR